MTSYEPAGVLLRAVAVADDVVSFPAVARSPRSVLSFHHLTRLDVRALRRFAPRDVQDLRAEARAARRAKLVLCCSDRVASAAPGRARVVPIAYPIPAEPLGPRDEP